MFNWGWAERKKDRELRSAASWLCTEEASLSPRRSSHCRRFSDSIQLDKWAKSNTKKTKQQQTRQGHTICYSLALYSCNSLHDWSRYRLVGQKENCKRLNFFGLSSCIHIFKRELLMLIHVSFHVRIPLILNCSFVHIWPHCFFRLMNFDLSCLTMFDSF